MRIPDQTRLVELHARRYFFCIDTERLFSYYKNKRSVWGMMHVLLNYVGRRVIIIYMDNEGRITQRVIRIQSIRGGKAISWDFAKGELRTFAIERILAYRLDVAASSA